MARIFLWLGGFVAAIAAMVGGAAADDGSTIVGQSQPGQLNLQEPVTLVGRQVYDLHMLMLWIITGITIFVLALLVIVAVRFNRKANPNPQSFTHNTTLEITWTVAPVIILLIIAVPSVQLLLLQEDFEQVEPDIVIKATGYQWYWGYQYPDEGIEFDAYMLGAQQAEMNDEVREELAEYGYPETAWKLATDNAIVVPVDKTVLVQVTGGDVIHSWAMPAFGVKADAVPGRLNQTWFRAEKTGTYFGQCSELCGKDHSFMPITVKVVSEEYYAEWLATAKEDFAVEAPRGTDVALASPRAE